MTNGDSAGRFRSLLKGERAQVELAEALGVEVQVVNNWTRRGVPAREIKRVARFYGVNEEWLSDGTGTKAAPRVVNPPATIGGRLSSDGHTAQNVRAALPTQGRVPVVSWVIAGDWAEIDDPQQLEAHDYQYLETSEPLNEHSAIALQVEGDSMFDPNNPDSFEPGCYIVVKKPELRQPKSGDFVVVRLENQRRSTFKQLVLDGDEMYLKALNPAFPIFKVESEATIVGVVSEKIIRKRY